MNEPFRFRFRKKRQRSPCISREKHGIRDTNDRVCRIPTVVDGRLKCNKRTITRISVIKPFVLKFRMFSIFFVFVFALLVLGDESIFNNVTDVPARRLTRVDQLSLGILCLSVYLFLSAYCAKISLKRANLNDAVMVDEPERLLVSWVEIFNGSSVTPRAAFRCATLPCVAATTPVSRNLLPTEYAWQLVTRQLTVLARRVPPAALSFATAVNISVARYPAYFWCALFEFVCVPRSSVM